MNLSSFSNRSIRIKIKTKQNIPNRKFCRKCFNMYLSSSFKLVYIVVLYYIITKYSNMKRNITSLTTFINKFILKSTSLNKKDIRYLCFIASCVSSKKTRMLKFLLVNAKESSVSPVKIYETIIQIYLFCGFPATIEALKVFNSVFHKYKKKSSEFDLSLYLKKGQKNCLKIYKANYNKLINNFDNLSPDLKSWMIIEGYGKVMGRPGLSIKERELINVAILSINFYEHQLYSHLKGALNTNSSYNTIKNIIEVCAYFNSNSNTRRSIELLNSIKN